MAFLMPFVLLVVVVIAFSLYKLRAGLRQIHYIPGIRSAFSPLSPLGASLPCTSWNPSHEWIWHWRKTAYFNHTHEVISTVPFLLGSPSIYAGSLDVMKQLLTEDGTRRVEKPKELTSALQLGDNITSVNADTWRTHRRVVAPSFNIKLYNDVWRSTRHAYAEMMNSVEWSGRDVVDISSFGATIIKVTFLIISSCGFSLDLGWTGNQTRDSPSSTSTSNLEFPDALRVVSETFIHRLLIPSWAYQLPFKRLREIGNAWDSVETYISAAIDKRKEDPEVETGDLHDMSGDILSRLVAAWNRDDKYGLSKKEVVSDMLSLVFAGHETTASGLSSTFAYLALNPDIQQKAFREVSRVFSENNPAERIDPIQLSYTHSCFMEALRLIPSAFFLPRVATEDLVLHVEHPQPGTIPISKGTLIVIDFVGIHRNPNTYENPDAFKPERWFDIKEQDISLFGFGPRSCVGRKFAQTEVVCFLGSFLRDWKIEPLYGKDQGFTKTEWEKNVLGQAGLTGTAFSLKNVPLTFVRREE